MNFLKKLFKNKKGSHLVESVMLTAFAVTAGGACVVYMGGVINESKNANLTGTNAVLPSPIQSESALVAGHRYRISEQVIDDIAARKLEQFSVNFKASNGDELIKFREGSAISPLNHDSEGNYIFTTSYYNYGYTYNVRDQWQIGAEYGPSYMYLGRHLDEFEFVYVSHSVYTGSITTILPYIYEI